MIIWIKPYLPDWLQGYRCAWLASDLLAGLTLAAYAIPVAIAYSSMAGLPAQSGLYGYLFGGLGYAFFGTSRQLAIGPTAAISLAVGTSLAKFAPHDPERIATLAALTALVTAVMGGLGWLLRLSQLVNFVSETVLLGFKAGAALSIAVTQLPKLFGLPAGGHDFFSRVYSLCEHLGDTNPYVLAFGLVAVLLLMAGEKCLPGRPLALLVVIASLLVMSLSSLDVRGIKVVGLLPQGLPALALPEVTREEISEIVPLALACLLLSYVESISAARTFAANHQYRIDPRRELLALGAANLLGGLAQAYPLAGGLSQSAVNDKAGAKTPMAILWASGMIGLVLLFMTALFQSLPEAVLAAIVLVAIKGLIDIRGLAHAWRVSRFDFNVAMGALIGVLFLGILKGVLLASIFSILLLLRRGSYPHVAFLGRIPGSDQFSDLARHPHNETIPGVVIFRAEAPLLYFNVEHIQEKVLERLAQEGESVKLVIADLSSSPNLDLAGAHMLATLQTQLASEDRLLRLVNAHANARDLLRAEGLEAKIGSIRREATLADLIEGFEEGNAAS
ncbi:SulP family inorganic anion transporter [Methylococcus sp. EFPC2]|uniref:SulP family inorganic anion transporter n=1 Tax=Methylococcus sp. EFPC2 TaxID=2812648 RepID=UPI001966E88E|nr:sulfate permease [Methylococcus sp. EFPC2]QSA97804.1 sulfate permease [Methylococcus sp. EFPC2]